MIYKGCQKRMIMLKNTGSELFEEAYFILKESKNGSLANENDMIKEANRIVCDNHIITDRKNKRTWPPLLYYLLGVLSGIGFCLGVIGICSI